MPEGDTPPPPDNLDELLAQFADRAADGEDLMELQEDEDLMEYQNLIYSLQEAIDSDEPSDAMARRIESNLRIAWTEGQESQDQTTSVVERFLQIFQSGSPYRSGRQRQQRFALITAGAALLLIIIALPIITATEPNAISGAAGGTVEIPIIAVAIVVVVTLAIVGLVISNRK